MELLTTPDMPQWLKWLIWAAMGLAALTIIWRAAATQKLLQIVKNELTSGGNSVKDMVEAAALDSKKALDLTKHLDTRTKRIEQRQKSSGNRLANVEADVSEIKKRQSEFERHLAEHRQEPPKESRTSET